MPTYWPSHQNRRPDILDIFIAKVPRNYNLNVSNINDLSSDHSPIILEFNSPPSNNLVKNPQLPGKIDWPIFQTTIETRTQLNPSLKSNEDIDASILKLTTDIHECLQLATTPSSTNTTNYPLPNHIKYLIHKKRKARSRWQSHKYPPDKLIFNQLKNKLSKALFQHSSSTYNKYIQNLTSQNSSLWRITKKILKTQSTHSPLRNVDNSWAISDIDKANLFGEYLSKIFTPHDIILNNNQNLIINQSLNAALPVSLPAKPTSPGEIDL